MKDAEIVAIGTEILLGDLVDTNTPWLSRKLAALGVAVHRHITIGDDKERIVATLWEAAFRSNRMTMTINTTITITPIIRLTGLFTLVSSFPVFPISPSSLGLAYKGIVPSCQAWRTL